jgi:hypothetical protein
MQVTTRSKLKNTCGTKPAKSLELTTSVKDFVPKLVGMAAVRFDPFAEMVVESAEMETQSWISKIVAVIGQTKLELVRSSNVQTLTGYEIMPLLASWIIIDCTGFGISSKVVWEHGLVMVRMNDVVAV